MGDGYRISATGPKLKAEVQTHIAEADLPHVFDRFYQADESRDRTAGTSGLGLAIVKAIAEAHGGSVGATSVSTGGARFWIDLPGAPG